jgi:hypothetical protein
MIEDVEGEALVSSSIERTLSVPSSVSINLPQFEDIIVD